MRATCIMRFDRVPKGNDFVLSSKVGPQPDPKKNGTGWNRWQWDRCWDRPGLRDFVITELGRFRNPGPWAHRGGALPGLDRNRLHPTRPTNRPSDLLRSVTGLAARGFRVTGPTGVTSNEYPNHPEGRTEPA